MMNLVEEMVEKIAIDIHGTTEFNRKPYSVSTTMEAFFHVRGYGRHFTGIDISEMEEAEMAQAKKWCEVDKHG